MKIVRMGSGNVILTNPKQWLDISAILFYFPTQKNTINKSQINIPATYASRVKS
jgi:hypothetical protein